MKAKTRERLKSAAIVLLAVNAIFLAYKSEVFREFIPGTASARQLIGRYFGAEGQPSGGSGASAAGVSVMVRPVCMAVVNELGARSGAGYSAGELNELYDRCANIFGEALGSASVPQECGEEQWRTALTLPGIFLDYQVPIPLTALVRWLGMSAVNENEDSASRFVVTVEEENTVYLYYSDGTASRRCETAASAENIRQIIGEFLPNGAYFAFEAESIRGTVESGTLLLPAMPEKAALDAENPMDSAALDQIAEQLELSVFGGASYSERDGTKVLVANGGSLRLRPDGMISYNSTLSAASADQQDDPAELIGNAYALLSGIRSGYTGDEELGFAGIEQTEDGRRIISFDYYVDGTPVEGKNGKAAVLTYENGRLLSMELRMRRYALTDETHTLLPALQAAAIAGGMARGNTLRLVYYDDGDERILPVWTAALP